MELLRIYINKKATPTSGFALLEVLLVMAMIAIIASATILFSMSSYTRQVLLSEQNQLVRVLQTARAESMQNKNQTPHGVAIDPDGYMGYVFFNGSTYETSALDTRIQIPRSGHIQFATSSVQEVVFLQVSGVVNNPGRVTLIDRHTSASTTIIINYEGAIY